MDFGWGDPAEAGIRVAYRRKGERVEFNCSGPVYILGPDHNQLTHVPRGELPGGSELLDLTRVPVIGIGGKRKYQPTRVLEFLKENPGLVGAFLLYPGSGNWDLGEGMIFVTSLEVLSGARVSGGRPEVQLTNFRWLRDGRWVADRARLLHNKVLETLEAEVEQEPGVAKMAEAIEAGFFPHRLRDECSAVEKTLCGLEARRVLLSGEQERDVRQLVRDALAAKLTAAGVKFVRDIQDGLTVSAQEIAPELVAQAETLGTIEIPGMGRRLPDKAQSWGFSGLVVTLSLDEVRQVTAWPAAVVPWLEELGDRYYGLFSIRGACKDAITDEGRWGQLREWLATRWLEVQRDKKFPKDEKVADPRQADPPATPEPVVWGQELFTGEEHKVFAALVHDRRRADGHLETRGWATCWFDDVAEAAKADAEARREAESYITARRLEAELTAEAKAELPVPVPAPYVAPRPYTPAEIMAMAGFSADQYRIREDVGYWYTRGYSSGRDDNYVWYPGMESRGSFARKGDDGMWEVGRDGLAHLLEGGSVGEYHWETSAKPVLVEMGAGDKIAGIHARLKAELEQSKTDYRASVRKFVEALRADPVFACLSLGMQAKLTDLPSSISWDVPSVDDVEIRAEWAKAEALLRRESAGEVLVNWGGHFRVMGATGNAQYWVVQPNGGAQREPDSIAYRGRYTSEGDKSWRLVGPDELALSWSKAYTAAPHEFAVAKLPAHGCTPEQLKMVSSLELEISERFHGARGMNRGAPSPEINGGWNLDSKSRPPKIIPEPAKLAELATPAAPASAEQIGDALAALRAKFGKK